MLINDGFIIGKTSLPVISTSELAAKFCVKSRKCRIAASALRL